MTIFHSCRIIRNKIEKDEKNHRLENIVRMPGDISVTSRLTEEIFDSNHASTTKEH